MTNKANTGAHDQEMVVVWHETEAVNRPAGDLGGFTKSLKENFSIGVVLKDALKPITPVHDMVKGSRIFDPGGAGHDSNSTG